MNRRHTTAARSAALFESPPMTEATRASDDLRDKLVAAGIEPVGGTPAQFNSFTQSEMTRWAKVAQAAGVQPE